LSTLLLTALKTAVPLWVNIWQPRSITERQQRGLECAQIVAEQGDVIMYRSSRKGKTAEAFNALAEGIAILSLNPGGVMFMGHTWVN
jgi:hypothetical protein